MKNYGRNIWLWLRGFRWLWSREADLYHTREGGRFGWVAGNPWTNQPRTDNSIVYQPGWGPWKFLPVYLFDVGVTVMIAAGAVEPLSTFMQRHRAGWLNDAVLDAIERFDADHGANSGKALWGSVESPLWVRVGVPAVWAGLLIWGCCSARFHPFAG